MASSNEQLASTDSLSAVPVTSHFSDNSAITEKTAIGSGEVEKQIDAKVRASFEMTANATPSSLKIVDFYMSQPWPWNPRIKNGGISETLKVTSIDMKVEKEHQLAANNTHILAKLPGVWPDTFVIPSNPLHRIGFEAIHPDTPFLPPIWLQEKEYDSKDGSYKVPTQFIIPFNATMPTDQEMRSMLPVFFKLNSIGWVPGLWSIQDPIFIFWGTRKRAEFTDGTKWRYFMEGDTDEICYRDHQWQMGGLFVAD